MQKSYDYCIHAPVTEIEKIRMVWDSIPKQLAKENNKFVFSHVKEGKRAHELEGALQWLKNAGLVHLVELVQNAQIPLSPNADATYFKVYMADCGLLLRKLGLSYKNILEENLALSSFKGAVTENFVLQELKGQNKNPYFWRSGNTAELDFLYEKLLVPGDFDHSVTGEKSQKVTRENDQKSHLTPLIIQFPEDCQKQFLPFL